VGTHELASPCALRLAAPKDHQLLRAAGTPDDEPPLVLRAGALGSG